VIQRGCQRFRELVAVLGHGDTVMGVG